MFTLLSIKDWLAQNWMLLLLLVLAVAMIVPTYLKQKKEMNNRQELSNSIAKGVKIVTTAGVYGVVESVEDTTDGKVVTIVTGTGKNPSTMTIHINAIMGIDNKTVVSETTEAVVVDEHDTVEELEEKVVKKTSTKKTTKK